MIYDAHVHVGYYSRLGSREPFYYSPRRVAGVLRRCGVEDFIVSSTCAQVTCIPLADVLREAREMKRVAGGRAHQFFWLAGRFYDEEHRAGLPIQSERAARKIVTLFWRLSCGDVAHDHACVGMLGGL